MEEDKKEEKKPETPISEVMSSPKYAKQREAASLMAYNYCDLVEMRSVVLDFSGLHDVARRPRNRNYFGKDGGFKFSRFYDPSADNKKKVRRMVMEMLPEDFTGAAEGEVRLVVEYWFPERSDFSIVERILAHMGVLQHLHTPDLDNMVKQFKDACKGLLWIDDCQVMSEQIFKYYSTFVPEGEEYAGDDPDAGPRMRITVWYRPTALMFRDSQRQALQKRREKAAEDQEKFLQWLTKEKAKEEKEARKKKSAT